MSGVQENVLIGMGNPLLDISAHVEPSVLSDYDLQHNIAILAEEKHMPLYKRLVDNYEVQYIAGGSTQNSIRVAQWMLKTPKATSFIGCVGSDAYAKTLEEEATKENVNVAYLKDAETPTGTCAVLVTGKERTLVANISAANNYKIEHLGQPEIWSLVEGAQYAYISGFFLTVSPESILKVAKHCASENKPFAMNLAAPFICEFFHEPLMKCLPYCDLVFGNETEADAFAKATDYGTFDIKDIALRISQHEKVNDKRQRICVITHGAEPAVVAVDGKVTEYPVTPIPAEEMIDTNGAGDAFVGGFLSQFVQGKSIEECMRAGQWCAAVIIRHSGCTFPETCDFE